MKNEFEKRNERFRDFYDMFSKKYFPESNVNTSDFTFGKTVLWLESDLKFLCLTHSITELKNYVYENLPYDKDYIDDNFNWEEIEEDAEVRKDFDFALKNCKRGTELSKVLGYSFSDEDISNLAKLHKENKHRKKIEDLLTDCNFHYESGCFADHQYNEFLKN